jgi:hypothetical protein
MDLKDIRDARGLPQYPMATYYDPVMGTNGFAPNNPGTRFPQAAVAEVPALVGGYNAPVAQVCTLRMACAEAPAHFP